MNPETHIPLSIFCHNNDCSRPNTCAICTAWYEGQWTTSDKCKEIVAKWKRKKKSMLVKRSSTSLLGLTRFFPAAATSLRLSNASPTSAASATLSSHPSPCVCHSTLSNSLNLYSWHAEGFLIEWNGIENLGLRPSTGTHSFLMALHPTQNSCERNTDPFLRLFLLAPKLSTCLLEKNPGHQTQLGYHLITLFIAP